MPQSPHYISIFFVFLALNVNLRWNISRLPCFSRFLIQTNPWIAVASMDHLLDCSCHLTYSCAPWFPITPLTEFPVHIKQTWSSFQTARKRKMILTHVIRHYQLKRSTTSLSGSRGRIIWSPTATCYEQTNLPEQATWLVDMPNRGQHAHYIDNEFLRKHPHIKDAVKLWPAPRAFLFPLRSHSYSFDCQYEQNDPTSFHTGLPPFGNF